MKPVALVAPADASRAQIAKYLVDRGYAVFECEDLNIPGQFDAVVMVDVEASDAARARVQTWLRGRSALRVVVVSTRPSAWRALSMSRSDDLHVLAAPAFEWEIVDALRATTPTVPQP